MLDSIKTFFTDRMSGGSGGPDPLVLAGAALLFEVIRADDTIDASEKARLRVFLRREHDLSTADLQRIEALVEEEAEDADLHQFASLILEHWDLAQRVALVEKMWVLAWADGSVDGLEAQTIRRLAQMLQVPEVDLVAARKRAERAPRAPR